MGLKCTMILGDCLEVMPTLPKASVQMCFADLPYGVTARNRWDQCISLPLFWKLLRHVVVKGYVCAITAAQPFASGLILSNIKQFKYDLIWQKTCPTGFLNARRMPLRQHEVLAVFGGPGSTYMPQIASDARRRIDAKTATSESANYGAVSTHVRGGVNGYPRSVLTFKEDLSRFTGEKRRIHPTQKPVALLDWLVRTYSNFEDVVLDPVSGSGTTAVAALSSGRSAVCVERDECYFTASVERVRKHCHDNAIRADIKVVR